MSEYIDVCKETTDKNACIITALACDQFYLFDPYYRAKRKSEIGRNIANYQFEGFCAAYLACAKVWHEYFSKPFVDGFGYGFSECEKK